MSEIIIREFQASDLETLHRFVITAFEPIFASFGQIMGENLFDYFFPDWHALQRSHVDNFTGDSKSHVRVADANGTPVGFISYRFKENAEAEIEFLFVDPDYQSHGVGTLLNEYALDQMRLAGIKVATVSTGGDPAHAPARRSYEKAGFKPVPQVWYIKYLQDDD